MVFACHLSNIIGTNPTSAGLSPAGSLTQVLCSDDGVLVSRASWSCQLQHLHAVMQQTLGGHREGGHMRGGTGDVKVQGWDTCALKHDRIT
jgi:hypothetical protein